MTKLTPLKDEPVTVDKAFDIDCVFDAEARQKHIDGAVARNLPIVVQRKKRKGKVAIVASGPSVTDCVDILKDWDGEIWGINRAFEWMRHRGVTPTGFLGIDPEWFLKDCIPTIVDDVTYYLAAQVHPDVFDHLQGQNIRLWYMADSQIKLPWGAYQIYGGSTCLSRAPNLAWALGYRDVHVFGGDSSYTHKTHVHGGELPPNTVLAEANGIAYKTNRAMISQACEYIEQMVGWSIGKDPMEVTIYGEGLMQSMMAEAMNSGNYEQYIAERAAEERKRA